MPLEEVGMFKHAGRLSRRMLLRNGAIVGLGAAAVVAVGCGDDDDDDDDDGARTEPSGDGSGSGAVDLGEPKDFALVHGWYKGEEVVYYDFGMNTPLASNGSVPAAPIWVLITGMDSDGTPQFVEGQPNIIDLVPGDTGYSDLWQVNLVTVPNDYAANTLKSRDEIVNSGYDIQAVDMFVNCPVVPAESRFEGGEQLVQGWYRGQQVFYPDFGANPSAAVPIWAFITGIDSGGNPQFVKGQNNIIDLAPDDAGYSAFWRVNLVMVDDGYEANSITSREEIQASAFEVTQTDLLVNCPVVEA